MVPGPCPFVVVKNEENNSFCPASMSHSSQAYWYGRGVVVDERSTAHGRIFERGDVHLGSIDEQLHDLQMQVCDEHRGSLRRNQIWPRIPLVEQWLEQNIWFQVNILGHGS